MLRVLHISMDENRIGASSTAKNLHEALLHKGIASELWTLQDKRATAAKVAGQALLTAEELAVLLREKDLTQYDLIHLHGIAQAASPLLVPFLNVRPLVWSLYDCAPYTAGCNHSAHCAQWKKDCASCPVYTGKAEKQQEQAAVFALKRDLYKTLQAQVVCSNAWQQEQLGQSILQHQKTVVLPLLSDREIFHLGNKTTARRNLGLPENSFVLTFYSDLGEAREEIVAMLQGVLQDFRQGMCHISLINIGTTELPASFADVVRNIEPHEAPALVGEYYRAASLNLYFAGLDTEYAPMQEAGLCGLPSIVFNIGGVQEFLGEGGGFVIAPFDSQALADCLRQSVMNPAFLVEAGMKIYQKLQQTATAPQAYLRLYGDLTDKQAELASVLAEPIAELSQEEEKRLMHCGWQAVNEFLESKLKALGIAEEKDLQQQNKKSMQYYIYVDQFCRQWLEVVKKDPDRKAIWQFVQVWTRRRKVDVQMKFISQEEGKNFYEMCHSLRLALVAYFQSTTLAQFQSLSIEANQEIIQLWRAIFLNLNSVLHLNAEKYECPAELLENQVSTGYPTIFLQTMFTPYINEDPKVNVRATLASTLPFALRVVLLLWITEAPLYNGTAFHQECILRYIKELAEEMRRQPEAMSLSLKQIFFEHFVLGLWRLSYLGGNTINTLRSYGDLLQDFVKSEYPTFVQPLKPRRRKKGEPLRIGYVSMNFRSQAVTQYMANRIKYHDKDKFFVKVFVLNKFNDAMTEEIKGWSDEWEEFKNLQDFGGIAAAIKKSELDMVIYADIGMNVLSYLLGAMHLAPVQSVLVGHGTTTGLTTIDYYISGDHEPQDAQQHYTEKIVRLPQLGAAQLPPEQNESTLTRAQIGVPEDAVLFISCANGLKHYPKRDALLIDILRQAPEAYIVLKPFQGPNTVDLKFNRRVMAKAQAAGVEKRLLILPPLPKPGDLMGLLVLADVQLDTYPYGGWTTNLEALYYHLPIVTQEGNIARSRWGAGLLRSLGIQEGIAQTEAEYVEWAVKFALDKSLRESIAARMEVKVEDTLFNGEAAQASYEKEILRMIEKKESRGRK